MIRTVLIPDKNVLSLNIPDDFIGKKVEVIAFTHEETSDNVIYPTKENKSFSAITISTKGFRFNRNEANER